MGADSQLVDAEGYDLRFYEAPWNGGVDLDMIAISVAPDDGTGNPGAYTTIFVWGDTEITNNGSILPIYTQDSQGNYREHSGQHMPASTLSNGSGISIDIGKNDGASYRFVKITAYPADTSHSPEQRAQVDAVERIDPAAR